MATFADLTEYSYLQTDATMLNVGWLGADAEFPRGAVAPSVVEALLVLAADPKHVMRGVHSCEFCDEESPIRLPAPVRDGWVSLGMGELHVEGGNGEIYAAPSLVIHYITAHGYCPPPVFQEAALKAAVRCRAASGR